MENWRLSKNNKFWIIRFLNKLYLCPVAKWTLYFARFFQYIHPCIRAKYAMDKKNVNYKIIWVPFFKKFRKKLKKISRQSSVPVCINKQGEIICDSFIIKSYFE